MNLARQPVHPFRSRLALGAYSAALRLLTPAYVLRLWWRGRREPLYRLNLGRRLALYGDAARPVDVWIHAVSLGETLAAAPLMACLRAQRPGLRLLLTTSTATGRAAGQPLLHSEDQHDWLPLDTPGAVRRFLRHYRPQVGVLMETEVWPNLQMQAAKSAVPMVLANARLSERSLNKSLRLDALMRPAAAVLAQVLAQTQADAQRLQRAGAPVVAVAGNLKFDITPAPALLARGQQWRQGLKRPVVLAAVTREGEETPLLAAWQQQRGVWAAEGIAVAAGDLLPPTDRGVRPLLVVVPRHPQRFDEVARLIESAGLSLGRRSQWQDQPPPDAASADVWLGDSMGEMPLYYGLADVALLGGSFAPLGGQNLIEAAACGCPLVMGPHTFNFAQAAEGALQAQAAERVPDMAVGVARAMQLAMDPQRLRWVERAQAFAAAHRGAAQRMATVVLGLLG